MDYCTRAQVKREIITEQNTDDDLIDDAIRQATDYIDRYTHTTFGVDTESQRLFHPSAHVAGSTLRIDEPLVGITAVTNAQGTTIPADAYTLTPLNWQAQGRRITGIVIKRASGLRWYAGCPTEETLITVTGYWGYSLGVPPAIERACIRLALFYYKQRESGVLDVVAVPEAGIIQMPKGFPKDVQILLRPFVQRRAYVL